MKFSPGNAQDIGARNDQQDSFAFSDPRNREFVVHGGFLAVVADGMGGLANGRQASTLAVRTFLSEYERKPVAEPIPEAMMRACRAASRAVATLNPPGESQTGSTLVASVAHRNSLYWLAMGDSHLYLLRGNELVQVNRDHNFGQRLLDTVARGEMSRAEAGDHPERDHLTSYLGMPGNGEVDRNLWPLRLEDGDFIILCTDGIYRAMSQAVFAKAFHSKPSEACEAIKRIVLAQRMQNQDNLTIVAIRCEDEAERELSSRPSKLLAGSVLLLLGLNLFAGMFAWRTLSEALSVKAEGAKTSRVDAAQPVAPPQEAPSKNVTGGAPSDPLAGSDSRRELNPRQLKQDLAGHPASDTRVHDPGRTKPESPAKTLRQKEPYSGSD
jgi:PPM family protein phosphatase